jgi:hypothetical protein
MSTILRDTRPLVIPIDLRQVFCSGLARIEFLPGGIARHYLYEDAVGPFGHSEKRAVVALLAPITSLPDTVEQMMAAMNGRAARAGAGAFRFN